MNFDVDKLGAMFGASVKIFNELQKMTSVISNNSGTIPFMELSVDGDLKSSVAVPGLSKDDLKVSLTDANTILKISLKSDNSLIKAFKIPPGFDVRAMKITVQNGLFTAFVPKKVEPNETILTI